MPQTFLAVRCYSCSAFQGIQRTQQSKYACKLCNTKQSITRVFASGTGKEVRLAVQTLNRARLEAAAVAQEEANAEYEAHYEQEHPDEYAEADGEYAEEAARCAQCGAATDDLDVVQVEDRTASAQDYRCREVVGDGGIRERQRRRIFDQDGRMPRTAAERETV